MGRGLEMESRESLGRDGMTMLDDLHAPCCPYCGGRMSIAIKKLKHLNVCWYECDNCMSSAPAAKTEKGAYLRATLRKETPNYVLTLVEACAKEFCWTEERRVNAIEVRRLALRDWGWGVDSNGKPAKAIDLFVFGEECPNSYGVDKYGKEFRCWLRKPTAVDLARTPWEDEDER